MADEPLPYPGPIVTLETARNTGARFYFTGKPCKHGHIAQRFTNNQVCRSCQIQWPKNNPENVKAKAAKYRNSHKEQRAAVFRAWRLANPDYQRKRLRLWHRAQSDNVEYKLVRMLRANLLLRFRGKDKGAAVQGLGCSIEELRLHLERQFLKGMSWDNYGKGKGRRWNIDHIIPFASINVNNPVQLAYVIHFTNLRPLWDVTNFAKSGRRILLL